MNIGKNMMLITSAFRNLKSFTLIPVSNDSPYVEAMYDPSSGILAVITKMSVGAGRAIHARLGEIRTDPRA